MAIRYDYTPDLGAIGRAAYESGAAVATRENADRSIGRDQEQQQFDAAQQFRYDAMNQQALQQEMDRRFRAEAAMFDAEQRQYGQAMAAAEWDRRLMAEQEAQREQEQWTYTTQQQNQLTRIDNELARVDELEASGDWTKEWADDARYQLQAKRMGIQPRTPKPRPFESYPTAEFGGRKVWVLEGAGRNGAPLRIDQETGRDIEEIAKEEHDLRLAQVKADQTAALNDEKANQQNRQMELKQVETQQKMEFERAKASAEMMVRRAEFEAKLAGMTKKGGADGMSDVPLFTADEIKAKVESAFGPLGGSQGQQSGAPAATTPPPKTAAPIRIHSSHLEQAAANAPPGTRFVTETGEVFEME
jgi:hypothetical protein